MHQHHTVHSLDPDEQQQGTGCPTQRSHRQSQTNSLVLSGVGLFCFLVTLLGNMLIINSPTPDVERIGQVLWMAGGVGMLIGCCVALALSRWEHIQWTIRHVPIRASMVRSPRLALWIWNILGFLAAALVVIVLHLVFGSIRTLAIFSFLTPVLTGLIFSLIGTSRTYVRAYWIGFATSTAFGVFGFEVGRYVLFLLSVNQSAGPNFYQNPYYGSSFGTALRMGSGQRMGYTFEYRMLSAQLSTLGWAIFNGILCSELIRWLEPSACRNPDDTTRGSHLPESHRSKSDRAKSPESQTLAFTD